MAKLNKTPLTIRAKRGTAAEIEAYTGYQLSGEFGYATDTNKLYVSNGTQFLTVGGGTLQSVTDEGNTTTNNIGIGTTVPSGVLHIYNPNDSGSNRTSVFEHRWGVNALSQYARYGIIVKSADLNTSLGITNQTYNTVLQGFQYVSPFTAKGISLNPLGGVVMVGRNAQSGDIDPFLVNSSTVGDAFIVKESGNVGIGTTAPSTSLHIKSTSAGSGYATIENTVHVAKLSLKSSSFTGHLVMDGTGGYISGGGLILDSGTNPRIQFLQSGGSKMAIVGGNVGIGTTAPSEKLQVSGGNILLDTNTWIGSGSGSGQPRLRFDNTNSQGKLQQADLVLNDEKSVAWSNTGTSIQGRGVDNQRIEFNVASSERMRITSTGIGIGTTTPSQRLDVNGYIASSRLVGRSTTGLIAGSHVASSYALGVQYNSNQNATSADKSILNAFGNWNPSSGLANFNGITVSPTLNQTGTALGGARGFYYNPTVTSVLGTHRAIETTAGDVIFNGGNVGIGTTAPSFKLDVNGTFRAGSNSSSNSVTIGTSGATTINTTSGNTGLTISDSSNGIFALSGGSQTYRFITSGSSRIFEIRDLTNADTTRLAIASNGNVGIGTTTPATKLHVNGGFVSGASTTSGLYFNPANDRLSISNQRVLEKSGASLFLGYNTNQLIFRTNNLERARFDVNGNLGIGTTAPNSKVHISGTAMQQLRMETAGGPSSAGDTSGRIGDMAYDNDFFYIKTANGWGRLPLDFGF